MKDVYYKSYKTNRESPKHIVKNLDLLYAESNVLAGSSSFISTICNGGQQLVGGGPHSAHHHPLPRAGTGPPLCHMVPHLHNDPFYCSPFGNPYYR